MSCMFAVLTKNIFFMKIIKLFIISVLFANTTFAQNKSTTIEKTKNHDVSIGLMNFTSNYKLSYDYLLKTNASIGTSISYLPKKGFFYSYSSTELSLGLNYKHYLSNKKKQQGFYYGSSLTAYSNKFLSTNSNDFGREVSVQGLYVGLMGGYKYVHKSGFFIEGNLTFSERLFSIDRTNRFKHNKGRTNRANIGISIGKRF